MSRQWRSVLSLEMVVSALVQGPHRTIWVGRKSCDGKRPGYDRDLSVEISLRQEERAPECTHEPGHAAGVDRSSSPANERGRHRRGFFGATCSMDDRSAGGGECIL